MLPTTEDIYNLFYKDLNPKDYYKFDLQQDLAKEAINYYIFFNNLKIINIEGISAPFLFTKNEIVALLQETIDFAPEDTFLYSDFDVAPDGDGGVVATYVGEKNIIMTIDVLKDRTIKLEVLTGKYAKNLIIYPGVGERDRSSLANCFFIYVNIFHNNGVC